MTAKQALKESYKHWLENWECSLTGEGKYSVSEGDCSLCVYSKNRCESCILKEYGFGCRGLGESPYRQRDRYKPETVGDMATLLLLIYLSEYGTHPNKN